jgi:NAD(P)-dependent dehydrogenase (short-subunit alcohol dehydrogenase family)
MRQGSAIGLAAETLARLVAWDILVNNAGIATSIPP